MSNKLTEIRNKLSHEADSITVSDIQWMIDEIERLRKENNRLSSGTEADRAYSDRQQRHDMGG